MENRINSVVELENNDKYFILKQAVYKNQNFYLAGKIDDKETKMVEVPIILQEINEEDGLHLEKVTDSNLYQLVARYLDLVE